MRLLRAEWRRLFARQFTRAMLLAVVLTLAGVGTTVALTSHVHNAATLAAAQRKADEIAAGNVELRHRCEQSQANPGGDTTGEFPPGVDCAAFTSYVPDPADLQPHQYSFRDETDGMMVVLAALLALFGFAVGASFIGAEWSSGGLMNLLVWRPGRLRLLAGKLVTLLLGVGTVTVVLSAAWLAALYGIARLRGDPSGTTSGLLRSLAFTDLRGLALATGAAALGFALASLGRHTATALGVAIGWLVIFEMGLRVVLGTAGAARPERFYLSSYVAAWLMKVQHYLDYSACAGDSVGPCRPVQWNIHMNTSAALLGSIVLILVCWAMLAFRRRDVS